MSVLPLLVVLIIVLDKYCFSHVLQRPLITCTLLGASLGCTTEAMLIGGSLELYYIAYESYGEYTPVSSGFLVSCITATYLISNGTDSSTAISTAYTILIIGMTLEYVLSLINMIFVPSGRKDPNKIGLKLLLSVMISCVVYVGYSYVLSTHIDSLQTALTTIIGNYPYVIAGINAVAILMPCIAFAILLRNIGLKDVPGALLAGVAVGLLICMFTSSSVSTPLAGIIVSLMAFALACYDFHSHKNDVTTKEQDEEKKPTNTIKGGAEKWW